MTDDTSEDRSSPPLNQFFGHAGFPFIFVPTPGFAFTNKQTDGTEKEEDTDEVEQTEENDTTTAEEKDDLRISQPEYTDFLKNLDFHHSRMVDVTKMLPEQSNPTVDDSNDKEKDESNKQNPSNETGEPIDNDQISDDNHSNDVQDMPQIKPSLENAAKTMGNELNHLEPIIQQTSPVSNDLNPTDTQKKSHPEEDDDTSKQATQNYDLHENEKEDLQSSKKNPKPRLSTQFSNTSDTDNLSSIPRLHTQINQRNESEKHPINVECFISPDRETLFQVIDPPQRTPPKVSARSVPSLNLNSNENHVYDQQHRRYSSSSDSDPVAEPVLQRSRVTSFPPRQNDHESMSADEELNDFRQHLKNLVEQEQQPVPNPDRLNRRPVMTASDILLRRLSDEPQELRRSGQHNSTETWLAMLEKLEKEHKQRLEQQQKQYEDYMQKLEANMKQRFEEYLSINRSNELHERLGQYRSMENDLINHYYPSYSNGSELGRTSSRTSLSRSQSRDDVSSLRIELSAKHAKHISDLKSYYEHEIEELTNQLNRNRMGQSNSTTRQSIETIERINNENIRLHDEVKQLRHSLKTAEEENNILTRKFEELKLQQNNRDLELKSAHRTIVELQKQINEANHYKERQDERFRQADRQALLYREENDKLKKDLHLSRERIARLEERLRDQENSTKNIRQQIFTTDTNGHRFSDETKLNSTMSMNMPTSREYGRFTLSSSRFSSTTTNSPRDLHFDSGHLIMNPSDDLNHSPRPLTRINDYINEKPSFPSSYVPPTRTIYSPKKSPSTRPRFDVISDIIENPKRESERLEEKFDDLLKRKRELEARINRIPTRGLTLMDRQLLETLERDIERVEQQISSVKLELRKMNILPTH